jgi:hypothetical protein
LSPNIQQTPGRQTITATYSGASEVRITNATLATQNTEYNHTLITNMRGIIIRTRGFEELKIAFVSGDSSIKYTTIPKGSSLSLDGLDFTGKILYMQSPNNNVIVEILETY